MVWVLLLYLYIFVIVYIYVTCIFTCCSSGVYLYFRILMYVKRHEQFEIGCRAILNKIHYYYYYFGTSVTAKRALTIPAVCVVDRC